MTKINRYECKKCGKKIVSMYAEQFVQNRNQHEISCTKGEKKE